MIVKNGGSSLARCLTSVKDAVNRTVIGDTGSTDNTLEIAAAFGAETIHVTWKGDFAEARNHVLQQARCDWILVLDADEMMDSKGVKALKRLVARTTCHAFDVVRFNYVKESTSRSGADGALPNPHLLPEADQFPAYVKTINTRLFRRNPEIWFERPVHETVVERVKMLKLPIGEAPFVIHHFGHVEDNESQRSAKNALYQEIGKRHLAAFPEDSRTAYELALGEMEHFKNFPAALDLFIRAIHLDDANTEAIVMGGVCLLRMQRHVEAIDLLSHARQRHSASIVLFESLGDAHLHLQQYASAVDAYSKARQLGGSSALLLAKCGVCRIFIHQSTEGLAELHQALTIGPLQRELLDILIAGALQADEKEFAATLAIQRLALGEASALHLSLANV